MRKIQTVLILLFILPVFLKAEKVQLWTPNEGLSNSHISQIYQDSQGYIWIATENGLNKFNGYNFTVYSEQPNDSTSLRGNYVYTVLEDKRGIFWVGSMGGLLQYDREKDRFHPFLIQDRIPFYLDRVTWLLEDRAGNIWVSYPNHGTICLDAETLEPTFYNKNNSGIKDDNIDCAYEDSFGNLWLGTKVNGVYLFNPETKAVKHFKYNALIPGSLSDDRVFSICEDSYGRVLVGTLGGGVNIFDRPTQTFTTIKTGHSVLENQIFCMKLDKNDNLWLGTDGAGIIRYNMENKKLPPIYPVLGTSDLSKAKIHHFFEDKQGNMWVALYQKGILFIPSAGDNFKNYGFNPFEPQQSIGTNCVISVLEDSFDNLWIGTDGGGMYKIDLETQKMEHFSITHTSGFAGDVITALFEDKDKNIWIGTYVNGIFRYNRQTNRFDSHYDSFSTAGKLSYDHISSFVQDKNGILWIGTDGGGLNSLNLETRQIKHYKSDNINSKKAQLSSNWIYTLYMDRDNKIWIGTYSGANLFDPETGTFANSIFINTPLDSKLIYSINQDYKGNIWLGGFSGLYCIHKETGAITQKTTLDGLPDNMINGVEEDNSHFLWLSTGNGLCRYNPETGDCLNFYAEDGIQSNEFRRGSHYKGKKDRLYFGGINGLTGFTPSHITYSNSLLYLAFTDLLVYNEPVQVGKSSVLEKSLDESESIHLKYNQRSFTFRFAALEFSMPQRVLYYTQMENFDKHWRLVNDPNRSITYTNLNPGKYIFKVKATLDGVNFLEREVKVIVEPPFWLSIWAKIIYAILVLLVIYFIYYYLENRIKQKQALMEKEQQKQLTESKLQFFTDISHEIRTPLTLILGPIEKLEDDTKDEKTLSVYKIIHQNALRILRLVNQLMDLRAVDKGKLKLKIEQTSLEEFINKIMDSFKDLATTKHIDFNLIMEDTLPEIYIDRDCIDKVIFNLLSNAFKFTNKGGSITIFIHIKEGQVEIDVEDTGIGIPKENQTHIFDRFYQVRDGKVNTKMGTGIGLHLSKMMIELHHGEISVESEPDKGSKFKILLPLDKNEYKPEEFGVTNGDATAMMVQPSFQFTEETEETDPEDEKKGTDTHQRNTRSILLVEDDVDILNYVDSELSPKYKIYKANNGKEGLSKALKYIPDIIVSDIVMPEMDGLTLCKLLKSNDKTCHIPIILLTAKTSVEQRIEGIEMGADSYIPKPFNLKHLETRIEKLIELRKKLKGKYRVDGNSEEMEIKVVSADEKLLQKFNDKLRTEISNPHLSVESISRELGLSRVHLNRRLKAITNESPGNYIRNFRLKQAALLLVTKKMSIAEVAYAVGFSSHAYFSNIFKEQFGMSPSEYVDTNKPNDESDD
ncbi:MAG: response regulator [Candidatus Symbiothrix sp.]|jgi:signal transduction histidine kinase/ligand-binding sensor domain-containing protein/DNA-binding response OmpR family regulator|nr:response regulator [Candidatus Symbiothrix sp.]